MAGLALFDFDGTLTRGDSFVQFVWRSFSARELVRLWPGAVLPVVGWATGVAGAQRAKEAVGVRLFAGWTAEALDARGRAFAATHLPSMLRPRGLDRLAWHGARGDRVVVVTASYAAWIEPWCAARGLGLIASRLEVSDGRLTGRLDGAECNGPEKVSRIRATLDLGAHRPVYAYGDSEGDRPMLALADEAYYRPFE